MTATKHTPTPWVLDGYNLAQILYCTAERGSPEAKHACGDYDVIAKCEGDNWKANAAYIVKAVNAHEALVEALENLVENYRSKNGDMGLLNHFIKEGDAALKLARGE
jgi:hypothetical protein